ncbi:MAG: 30S ribosomal protein S17 [Methanobacteriota archaeon]|nr:MAG: 30S ribosomal protein S17 [Euryarchaeota archaeon]
MSTKKTTKRTTSKKKSAKKAEKKKDIGIDVAPPKKECSDPNCPFHGHLKVRGQIIKGRVVSESSHQTVIVERRYLKYDQKYERSERRVSRYPAYNPRCINATVNSEVRIMECRPLSKTKSFVVVEVV